MKLSNRKATVPELHRIEYKKDFLMAVDSYFPYTHSPFWTDGPLIKGHIHVLLFESELGYKEDSDQIDTSLVWHKESSGSCVSKFDLSCC